MLSKDPAHAGALHGFGVLALQAGRPDLAIGLIGQAARQVPDHAGYHLDLGLALREQGHIEEARAAFHVATLLDPADAAAVASMAEMLVQLNRLEDAAAAYADAVRLAPDRASLRHRLALILIDLGQPEAAEAHARTLLSGQPHDAGALNTLGLALQDQGRADDALTALHAARDAAPDDPDIANNLGIALRDLDRTDAALAVFEAVLARSPDHASAHLNAASVRLMRGEFARGWRDFEWRDRVPGAARPAFSGPVWRGAPLDGRILLVHAEMGFGDTIQFARFLTRLEGSVFVTVPAPLVRLLRSMENVTVIGPDDPAVPYDVQCSLLSLPLLLGIDRDDLGPVPYLRARPEAVRAWEQRLRPLPGPHIGLCWAGNSHYARDRARSLPPDIVRRLCGALPTPPISLQKGARPASDTPILDWTDELSDFDDTAALVEALDVIITVDTAVVHLAGALGKPTFLLDRFAGDWRWMRGRTDSPWYPTVRILRQSAPCDWDSVLASLPHIT